MVQAHEHLTAGNNMECYSAAQCWTGSPSMSAETQTGDKEYAVATDKEYK